jgi:flagellar hook-associated protein 1 FlgK
LGLLTAEHNITNANTPGYNRQRTLQATNVPIMTGSGAIGQGTHVSTIERMYSQFLSNQVTTSQTNVSELEAYYSEIKQIDNMLADPNSGLSPALQDFFRGIQQVASNPSSLPSRQSMISAAEAMVSRFHSIEDRLSQLAEGVNSQITSLVSTVNSYAQQIANLNERIVVSQAASNQPANDLLDQRDQVVAELNKLIKVSTTTESDGSYNVFIGTGQQLVVGVRATAMTATASTADPSRIVVGLETAGKALQLPEYLITGGQLGGLVRFRAESLDRAFNEMGRVAASMALTFNAQHGLGQDLLGQSAGGGTFVSDFFNMQNMQPVAIKNANNSGSGVIQAAFVSPPPIDGAYTLANNAGVYTLTRQSDGQSWSAGSLALLQAALPSAEEVNVASASVALGASTTVYSPSAANANFYTKLTVSDYRLSYDGTNYVMTRLSDGKQLASDPDPDVVSDLVSRTEGFTVALASGTVNAGDSFLIQPTRTATRNISVNANLAADPRLVAVGQPFRTGAALTNTGTGTITNGQTLTGYTATSLPPGGVTLTFNAGAPNTLTGFPAGANVSVTPPGGTTTVYPGGAAIPYTAGATINFSGVSFQISGNPNNADAFTLKVNTSNTGVADSRNAVLLGKLQTLNTIAGGSANYQSAYAQFVSQTGNKTREIQVTGQAQQALLEQAQGSREALSGVNLDEEAANLLRYQQAYQAAAKMLDIGSKLLDTVLAIRS